MFSSPMEMKPQLSKLRSANMGGNNVSPLAAPRASHTKYAPQPAPEVKDVTPPSSPINLDQIAKAIGSALMMSSFSLPPRTTATTVD